MLDSDNDEEKPSRGSSLAINQDICSNKSEDHKTSKIKEQDSDKIKQNFSPFAGTISKSGVEELENMLWKYVK